MHVEVTFGDHMTIDPVEQIGNPLCSAHLIPTIREPIESTIVDSSCFFVHTCKFVESIIEGNLAKQMTNGIKSGCLAFQVQRLHNLGYCFVSIGCVFLVHSKGNSKLYRIFGFCLASELVWRVL